MRFLIVDDDESIHLYLKNILKPYASCESALSGAEALSMFRKAVAEGRPYEAVFMDILMPGMDGHEVAERLREEDANGGANGFNLVMITSLADSRNVSKAFFDTYATCYIVKPFDKDVILDELYANMVI
ncbi:response regulator [Desulfovibrio oxyclinae]|jgi:two-component system chemotaxis response regulator CheY|uniref:response regulator n=1 Tax=Desulfovibrio oxyclinae TaxID=63560 RepID=UPI00037C86D0|nr:response regulator [Desulfovibrio oxyclinae]